MSDLFELITRYRRGRDGFDDLALEVTRLYAAGTLLPPLAAGVEKDLTTRLQELEPDDVERALDGKLGTIPLSRAEYTELLADITAFIQEWLGGMEEEG